MHEMAAAVQGRFRLPSAMIAQLRSGSALYQLRSGSALYQGLAGRSGIYPRLPQIASKSVRASAPALSSGITRKLEGRWGFTSCGNTPSKGHEVSGHDFSRAVNAAN
jgi:hypothetical protein